MSSIDPDGAIQEGNWINSTYLHSLTNLLMCYTNSMKQHIMIDLETLGTTIDSNILTVGALKFDPNEDYRNWTWGDFPKIFAETITS